MASDYFMYMITIRLAAGFEDSHVEECLSVSR